MKKIFICSAVIMLIAGFVTKNISADENNPVYSGIYNVSYDGSFTSTTEKELVLDEANGVTPGDDIKVTYNLVNDSNQTVDWYMDNKSVEFNNNFASGAAYVYKVTYQPHSGAVQVLYDSEDVGGDGGVKRDYASDELEDFFLLERFGKGEKGSVTLYLAVEGETQNVNYQVSRSDLVVEFGVTPIEEPTAEPTEKHVPRIIYIPNTGDSLNVQFYVIMEMIALILMAIIVYLYYRYRKNQERA